MDAVIRAAVKKLEEELVLAEQRVVEIKRAINVLYDVHNEAPPYDITQPGDAQTRSGSVRSDQFFGKPFSTSVKEVLRMRGEALTAEAIHEALKAGGYEFNGEPTTWLRTVAINIAKNRKDFCPVPGKKYGLYEWYPTKQSEKERKREAPTGSTPNTDNESDSSVTSELIPTAE